MDSKEKKNLFYCYSEPVANHLVRCGLTPVLRGVNQNTQSEYWVFERGAELDAGLDSWQKKRWQTKLKQTGESMK